MMVPLIGAAISLHPIYRGELLHLATCKYRTLQTRNIKQSALEQKKVQLAQIDAYA
jgi:hypothetical protein